MNAPGRSMRVPAEQQLGAVRHGVVNLLDEVDQGGLGR